MILQQRSIWKKICLRVWIRPWKKSVGHWRPQPATITINIIIIIGIHKQQRAIQIRTIICNFPLFSLTMLLLVITVQFVIELRKDHRRVCGQNFVFAVYESIQKSLITWIHISPPIQLAVYMASCIGIALNGIGILFYSFQNQFLYGLPSLVSVIIYFSALFAQYRQKANLFLLFLVINVVDSFYYKFLFDFQGLILFLWACLCVYLAALLILLPDWCVQLVMEYYEWEELGQIVGTPGSEKIRNSGFFGRCI